MIIDIKFKILLFVTNINVRTIIMYTKCIIMNRSHVNNMIWFNLCRWSFLYNFLYKTYNYRITFKMIRNIFSSFITNKNRITNLKYDARRFNEKKVSNQYYNAVLFLFYLNYIFIICMIHLHY